MRLITPESVKKSLRGIRIKNPDFVVLLGCVPKCRYELHSRGVWVHIPKGLTLPHSEE